MATLMARIKDGDTFKQVLVEYNKAHRPVKPANATSYFIRTRKEGLGEIIRQTGGQASYKTFEGALVELARVNALELSPKLLEDFQAHAVAQPVVVAAPGTDGPISTWAQLFTTYRDYLSLEVKKRETGGKKSRKGLSPKSGKRYVRSLTEFDRYLSAKHVTALSQITEPLVEAFKSYRIDQIKKNGGTGEAYVADTCALRILFNYAIEQKIVTVNPVKSEGSSGADASRGAQPLSAAEIQKIAARLPLETREDALLFWVLLQTGMRAGDCRDLRWSEVNGKITRIAQKNGKDINLPLSPYPELQAALKAAREERNPAQNDHVLLNPETKRPLTESRLYERIKQLGKRVGVPQVHPHRFRDTFVTDCYLRGLTAQQTAALVADSLATLLKHYTMWGEELRDQTEAILANGSGKGLLEAVGA
jgi:integrase